MDHANERECSNWDHRLLSQVVANTSVVTNKAVRRTRNPWEDQSGVIGSHRVLPSQKPGRKVRELDEYVSQRTRNSPITATTCLQ